MMTKEVWEEKCSGRNDVLSAWLLVLAVLVGMNVLLSLTNAPLCPWERSAVVRADASVTMIDQGELSGETTQARTCR